MKISATDPNGITTLSNVERIQISLPDEEKSRKCEVYFNKTVTAPNGRQISKVWENDPLIVNLSDPKIVQALALFKEVIEAAEWTRITQGYAAKPAPSPTPVFIPLPGTSAPTPSPSPAPVPTPTPPNRPT